MKNVNGLLNAMRIVESACEEGEITIIGQGAMPTAEELLTKCVAFINKEYHCDILNQVIVKQSAQPTPYVEDDNEWEDDEEEEEEEEEEELCYIQINYLWNISIKERLEEKAPYLSLTTIVDIIDELGCIVEELEYTLEEDYDRIYILEKIANILDEVFHSTISGEEIDRLANCILLILEHNMSI